jgi:prepilin-type N-terminal cleavage/methylation domain-containing protein
MKKLKFKSPSRQGFTIIEVVLALAIAGLIFLMVFIALPALQRSQRDSQRKRDIDRFFAAIQNYQSNNKGNVPVLTHEKLNVEFVDNYLKINGENFNDPSGVGYYFASAYHKYDEPITLTGTGPRIIHIRQAAKCASETMVSAKGVNKFALAIVLEGGRVYCVNN